tara:strand:+ start:125 stop:883 length:759 start_codon:yes stop_codon:yes gene_type:complete
MKEETRKITLPTGMIAPTMVDPELLILYGLPKVGKTALLARLENALIVDLEKGAKYINALKIEVNTIDELTSVIKQVHAAGKPYDFAVIDTVSKLEDMMLPVALEMYKATPMGSTFKGDDILSLPNGGGYHYLRMAFSEWLRKIKFLADRIILVAHMKDSVIDKDGKDVTVTDLQLTGKIKFSTAAEADGVGFVHRNLKGDLLISFQGTSELVCGSRVSHLKNKIIKMAEYDETTNELVNVNWKAIYPDKLK